MKNEYLIANQLDLFLHKNIIKNYRFIKVKIVVKTTKNLNPLDLCWQEIYTQIIGLQFAFIKEITKGTYKVIYILFSFKNYLNSNLNDYFYENISNILRDSSGTKYFLSIEKIKIWELTSLIKTNKHRTHIEFMLNRSTLNNPLFIVTDYIDPLSEMGYISYVSTLLECKQPPIILSPLLYETDYWNFPIALPINFKKINNRLSIWTNLKELVSLLIIFFGIVRNKNNYYLKSIPRIFTTKSFLNSNSDSIFFKDNSLLNCYTNSTTLVNFWLSRKQNSELILKNTLILLQAIFSANSFTKEYLAMFSVEGLLMRNKTKHYLNTLIPVVIINLNYIIFKNKNIYCIKNNKYFYFEEAFYHPNNMKHVSTLNYLNFYKHPYMWIQISESIAFKFRRSAWIFFVNFIKKNINKPFSYWNKNVLTVYHETIIFSYLYLVYEIHVTDSLVTSARKLIQQLKLIKINKTINFTSSFYKFKKIYKINNPLFIEGLKDQLLSFLIYIRNSY